MAQRNRDKVLAVADHICRICRPGKTPEELLRQLFIDYDLMMTHEQYVLIGSTVRSYTAWLKDSGRLTCAFEDNRLIWQAV